MITRLKDNEMMLYQIKQMDFDKAELILQRVLFHTGQDIRIKSRIQHLLYCRFMYYALCRELTKLSLSELGTTLNQNHATVLHAVKQFHNFGIWGLVDYIKIYDKIKSEFSQETRAEKVEELIRENVKLRYENNKLRKQIEQ